MTVPLGGRRKRSREERKVKTEIDTEFPYQNLNPQPWWNYSTSENVTLICSPTCTIPPEFTLRAAAIRASVLPP